MDEQFPAIRFQQTLRPSQRDVVEIARRELAAGNRRLHIVAPPGSGKTVLGLYLWSECIRRRAVVLSPNSAIQAQWAARIDLFAHEGAASGLVSSDPLRPGWLTSLTYQSVTLPARGDADAEGQALELWRSRLIEKGQAEDDAEATAWIEDLRRHNPSYYDDRLSSYRKQIRDALALEGNALGTLHASSRAVLERLRDQKVGLIILDECHHLLGHWGRVLADAHELLEQPIVVGLTATPPDRRGKPTEDVERYDEFFGPVCYEVPVPAVVKDGFLAPYQDLAYFVRPTPEELAFLATADAELHKVVEDLCTPIEPEPAAEDVVAGGTVSPVEAQPAASPPALALYVPPEDGEPAASAATQFDAATQAKATATPSAAVAEEEQPPARESLPQWLQRVLATRHLPSGKAKDWAAFERRDPQFALAARLFLQARGEELPEGVPAPYESADDDAPAPATKLRGASQPSTPPPDEDSENALPEMAILTPVLDRYIRHRLRRSPDQRDHAQAERAIQRLRMLGMQITETGCQACASPVGRVLAYARGKALAVVPILTAESKALGDKLRAVVVTDFEKSSAVSAEVAELLDAEAGGAMAAFRVLLSDPATDALDPVLLTGSSVLVDDDLTARFLDEARAWLRAKGYDVELASRAQDGFHVITGRGGDWCPRVYVTLITELFQQGVTRCLVGTRGLLGEGWDANKVNVLIDLTTVTTSMSVNQLRGRSIRIDPQDPVKLADNWDVICIAPEFTKGLDDYARFIDKHQTLYGVTEDGAIEKGVGHVHAALTELKPEGLEGSIQVLNVEMLDRAAKRDAFRPLWKIGEPYQLEPLRALEVRASGLSGLPPFPGHHEPWSGKSLANAVGLAVLGALEEAGLIAAGTGKRRVQVGERAGGYVRVFLADAQPEDVELFTQCLHEALGPLHRPRYVVPRYVDRLTHKWFTRFMPQFLARYFQERQQKLAVLHAVPTALARNKELVAIYEAHWNQHVSPGEAAFTQRGEGEELLARARDRGQTPKAVIHEKEILR